MKLSEHFNLREFTRSASVPRHIVTPTYYQLKQMKTLCRVLLEPIRTQAGVSCRINSGIRDEAIYEALKLRGYNPSKTSDHFYQSPTNPIGAGAADITFDISKAELKAVYKWAIKNLKGKYNQILYYPDEHFIHVALSRRYSYKFVRNSTKQTGIKQKNGRFA